MMSSYGHTATKKMLNNCPISFVLLAVQFFSLVQLSTAKSCLTLTGHEVPCEEYCCLTTTGYKCSASCVGYNCLLDTDCHGSCCGRDYFCSHSACVKTSEKPTSSGMNCVLNRRVCSRTFGNRCYCGFSGECEGDCSIPTIPPFPDYTLSPPTIPPFHWEQATQRHDTSETTSTKPFSSGKVIGVCLGVIGAIVSILGWLRYLGRRRRTCIAHVRLEVPAAVDRDENQTSQERTRPTRAFFTGGTFPHTSSSRSPHHLHPPMRQPTLTLRMNYRRHKCCRSII